MRSILRDYRLQSPLYLITKAPGLCLGENNIMLDVKIQDIINISECIILYNDRRIFVSETDEGRNKLFIE